MTNKNQLVKKRSELTVVLNYLNRIEAHLTSIEKALGNIELPALLAKKKVYIGDPKKYLLILRYLDKKSNKILIDKETLENDFQKLVKAFRAKKGSEEYNTFSKFLEYACLGGEKPYKLDAICGEVSQHSVQYKNLQSVDIDKFLDQYETFKKAEKSLEELFEKNDSDTKTLMVTLSANRIKNHDHDWKKLIDAREKEKQKGNISEEELKKEIDLCKSMKGFEDKYNVNILLMFRTYKEYL